MAYCTKAHLIAAIGEQTLIDWTDDERRNAIDQARLDTAIASADTLIDSFLRGRYSLPLAETPELIRDISVDLAIAILAKRQFVKELPPAIKERRDAAVKLLERIANGSAVLPDLESAAVDANTGGVRVSERTRLFGDLSAY